MSFYIRKSVKFGPLRFNFSKSGIGVSAGVKGARIATGPRGTYIHLGRNGIYYRQKIDGSIAGISQETSGDEPFHQESNSEGIPTANGADLVDASNKELLDQINSRIQQRTYASSVRIISILIAGTLGLFSCLSIAAVNTIVLLLLFAFTTLILLIGLEVASATAEQEKLAKITTLQYKLDDEAKSKFIDVQNALDALGKSECIWRVTSETSTWDWKRNSGATSLVKRIHIKLEQASPPFIQTPIKVYGLFLDSIQLYFLPDQILVFQNGKYGAVTYAHLKVSGGPTRFIEDGNIPRDAQIVDSTWRYLRKDGGPDMRFSDNRRIPIAQYGYFELSSENGLDLHFQVSNLLCSQQFVQALLNYIRYCQAPNAGSDSRSNSSRQRNQREDQANKKTINEPTPSDENPYSVLNVSPNASWAEISTAYRKMAQMYHPDKVAGLAPEYQDIAEKRMKIINAAYELLERDFKT
jgi:uncharacterized protein DUF4236/DnaJ-like protein